MKRLMIGQYGHFDKKKQERDYRDDFYGMEICMMDTERDIQQVVDEASDLDCRLGIHFPLRATKTLRDPVILSKNMEEKLLAYKHIEDELEYIYRICEPSYILFHFPKPVILTSGVDFSRWRFADKREYVEEADYAYGSFLTDSKAFLEYISKKARYYGFTPILELDSLNDYMSHRNDFIQLLEQYPVVKICLDIARLHLQACIDNEFKPLEVVEKYAPYTYLVHLSNGRIRDNDTNNHYPALPDLILEDGWADVEKYMKTINRVNRNYLLLFEHRSDRISTEQLNVCYSWVTDLIDR